MSAKNKIITKSCITAFVILVMLAGAQAKEIVHNGYLWTSMGHIAKGYFLDGFGLGIKEVPKEHRHFEVKREEHLKIINGLDLFYKDIANKEVHFRAAIFIVLQEIQGKPPEMINKLTIIARKHPESIPHLP